MKEERKLIDSIEKLPWCSYIEEKTKIIGYFSDNKSMMFANGSKPLKKLMDKYGYKAQIVIAD